jgi:hypothetical protein
MPPIKGYLDLGLIIAILIGIGWFAHFERTEEKTALVAAQQAADFKEAQHVAQVNANATASIQDLQVRLAAALVAPAKPNVIVRVCQRAGVPANGSAPSSGTGAVLHDSPGPGGGVGEDDLGLDIAPPTEAILKRDKAVIDYLQGYIRTCQTTGGCAK